MELQKLDAQFQPDDPIEKYESLIWTERYGPAGDFELVSSDISTCLKLMPLESYVSIRESTVPMIVESHKIVKQKNGSPKIEIRGRSFESVLERRGSVISLPTGASRATWSIDAVKQSDAAYHAMRAVLGDITRVVGGNSLGSTVPMISPLDAIPEINLVAPADLAVSTAVAWNSAITYVAGTQVSVTTGTAPSEVVKIYKALATSTNVDPTVGTPAEWKLLGTLSKNEIQAGNLYSAVNELVQANHHGIKSVRPPNGSTKTTVDIEIYNGADITGSTVFDAKFDQFDDATYLLSYQGSTNIAYVYGGNTGTSAGGTSVRKNNVGDEVSGLARRVLVVDEMSDATLNTPVIRTSRGLVELYKNNAIAIFDGELAQQLAAKYNQSVNSGGYSLGDIVQFNGEYNLSRKVRVVEFIRSFDATGETAYPAFEVIEE
jgi:hypothetical protein